MRPLHVAPLFTALSIVLPNSSAAAQRLSPAMQARIDSLVRVEMEQSTAPGVQLAIMRRTSMLLERGYGVRDVVSRQSVQPTTPFAIGSITKLFTASAVLRAAADGKLSLQTPVQIALRDDRAGGGFTIAQLLNHTSGIARHESAVPNVVAFARTRVRPDTVLHFLRGASAEFEPGARWSYSNTGYHVLGLILARTAGEDYFAHVRRTVLTPFGLSRTAACDDTRDGATGHERENGVEVVVPVSSSFSYAAGGLCSTAGELVRLVQQLARAPWAAAMRRPTILPTGDTVPYGFGAALGEVGGRASFGHGGSLPGFDASAAHYHADSLTIAVLANIRPFNSEALQKRIARLVLDIAEPVLTSVPLSSAERSRYIGTYRTGGGALRIEENGASLRLLGPGNFELVHRGNERFVAREEPEIEIRFLVRDGVVTGLIYTAPGRRYEMTKDR